MPAFQTIKGFVDGDEPGPRAIGVVPRDASRGQRSRAGLRRAGGHPRRGCHQRLETGRDARPSQPPSKTDVWLLRAPVDESRELAEHLSVLSGLLLPHADFLQRLKRHATVAVLLGYASNIDHGGFVVPVRALRLFEALQVDVSVYVTMCPDD